MTQDPFSGPGGSDDLPVPGGSPSRPSALDDLDFLFDLPTSITEDDKLRRGFEVLSHKLRTSPMATIQLMLLERITTYYVAMRAKEQLPIGDQGGYVSTTSQKDFNAFWLQMTSTFIKAQEKNLDELEQNIFSQVLDLIRDALSDEDDSTRDRFMTKLAEGFSRAGM